MKTVT